MSNQIVITSGAKLRDLDDVIIGTDGILSSVAFNVANGVPRLDENGKILVSQLPNSVMEFKGVWNAATNTPTLANGTGNAGDVWLCNVAGTVDFGAGPIAFAVGDYAVYTGTVWARSSGATGTVTSVGVSRDGNALAITGSPVTTSGTINLGFSGDNTQYINGAGNLTTFPTLITSIGLTMPAAFGVSNSPLTANGTIGVTALGYPSQYIRGDGTLADFPTSGGGGSSVSYYLNGGVSQGTIGGTTYYEMSKIANTGTGVDFSKTGDGFITAFLTDAGDPALLQIPAGNWNYEIYASMSSNGGTPEMYAELYVYDGTTFTLLSTSAHEILYDGVNLNLYTFAMAVPETVLTVTDRLAIKLYATNSGGKTTTIHTQDSHLCQIITTFTTGLTALNGLTAQVQYFGTGTSGSDFNIVSSVDTHTFNLPTSSATKRGALSSTDWSTFNGKQDQLNGTGFVKATGTTIYYDNSTYALDADVVHLTGNETIGGTKTFSNATKNDGGILLQNGSSYSLSGYMNLGGMTNGLRFTSGLGISNYFALPSATGYTYTFPSASGTVALTSDLTGGTVTSVGLSAPTGFSVSGSPVTTSGTLALSFASGYSLPTNVKQSNWDDAYTWVAAFPTQTGNNGKFLTTDGSSLSWAANPLGTVTSVAMSVPTGLTVSGSPITTSGTLAVTLASGYVIPTQATLDGFVTLATTQSISGAKTFTSVITNTISSGSNIILNKGTGPSISFNKTNSVAQSWSISTDPSFRIYDDTAGVTQFQIDYGTGNVSIQGKVLATGSIKSIASGGYGLGTEQLGASIQNNASVSTVPAVARFSNNGSGYTTKIILTDNSIVDANIVFTPNAITTSTKLGFYVGGYTSGFYIDGDGKFFGINALFSSSVTASSLVKTGGTSSQFLKADGSVDSSTYLTTSSASSTYVPYSGANANVNLGSNNLLLGSGNNGGHIDLIGSTTTAYLNIESSGAQINYNSSTITLTDKQFGGTLTLNLRPTLTTGNAFIQTFQNATGTIALTSDIPSLSGYLPLTASSSYPLTGDLYIRKSNARLIIDNASTVGISMGQWDTVTNRIESAGRSLFLTTYSGNVEMGLSGSVTLSINATAATVTGKFISNSVANGSGEYYFFNYNSSTANILTAYSFSDNAYINAYSNLFLRSGNTGGTGNILLTGGYVMIGSGSAPETPLHLYNATAVRFNIQDNTATWALLIDNATSQFRVRYANGAINPVIITTVGNILIGNTLDYGRMTVSSSAAKTTTDGVANCVLHLSSSETTNPFGLKFIMRGAASADNRFFSIQTGDHGISNQGGLSLQSSGGNVMIGTENISDVKLTVASAGDKLYFNVISGGSYSIASIGANGTAVNGFGIFYLGKGGYDKIILSADGNSSITSAPSFSTGGNYGLNISHSISPTSNIFNNGGTWAASNNYQQINWSSSSTTLNSGAVIAGFNAINRNQFTASGVSISVGQASSGIRAVSAFQILQQTGGTYAGTISHGASMFIQGIYPTNTVTTTFTNYYGLLINALDEWQGSLPYISITNRWGIYQAGSSDKNYFAGNVSIGYTTNSYKLDVSGDIRATAQLIAGTRLLLPSLVIGYWDSANNRFESADRPMLFTQYGSYNITFGHDGGGNQLTIRPSGYVYIGEGYSNSNHRINLLVGQGSNILVISGYTSSSNDTAVFYGASGALGSGSGCALNVSTNTSTGRSINAGGTINASGGDYAEYIYKSNSCGTVEKGDIVGIDIDAKLTDNYSNAISFVVKSTNPSYVGGDTFFTEIRPTKTENQTNDEWNKIITAYESRLEIARQKVDRVAFCGQVPCNVYGAKVGDYIIPINENNKIKGQAITNPTFEQYQNSIGRVWRIMEDGRAWITIKIS